MYVFRSLCVRYLNVYLRTYKIPNQQAKAKQNTFKREKFLKNIFAITNTTTNNNKHIITYKTVQSALTRIWEEDM